MTNVRFKDRIHLTQVLYVGKGLKDNDPVRGQRRGCGCESPLQVGEEGGGRKFTGNHSLPIFVRLSSSLSEWSCLILLQFCNDIVLPLLVMRRQDFLTSNADGRDIIARDTIQIQCALWKTVWLYKQVQGLLLYKNI